MTSLLFLALRKAIGGALGILLAKLLTEKTVLEVMLVAFKSLKNWTVNTVDDEIYEIVKKAVEKEEVK